MCCAPISGVYGDQRGDGGRPENMQVRKARIELRGVDRKRISEEAGSIPAFIVDPVCVDEMSEVRTRGRDARSPQKVRLPRPEPKGGSLQGGQKDGEAISTSAGSSSHTWEAESRSGRTVKAKLST